MFLNIKNSVFNVKDYSSSYLSNLKNKLSSNFFQTLSNSINEKFEEALVILEPVSINKSDINHDEAIWLCANIKHKQNKNEEARKLLLQLSESPLFKYKAEKLLNKL